MKLTLLTVRGNPISIRGRSDTIARDLNGASRVWLQTDQYLDVEEDLMLSVGEDTLDRSSYAAGNPVMNTDPDGHDPDCFRNVAKKKIQEKHKYRPCRRRSFFKRGNRKIRRSVFNQPNWQRTLRQMDRCIHLGFGVGHRWRVPGPNPGEWQVDCEFNNQNIGFEPRRADCGGADVPTPCLRVVVKLVNGWSLFDVKSAYPIPCRNAGNTYQGPQ